MSSHARFSNVSIVRGFYGALFTPQGLRTLADLVAPGYVDHNAEAAGRGPDVVRAHVEALRATLSDFSLTIQDIIADGDRVVTRVTGQGIHTGAWMGIAPTGTTVRVKGINIDRLVSGRLVEHWGEADTVGMLRQMGVDPFAGRLNP